MVVRKHRGRFVDRTVVIGVVLAMVMLMWIGPGYLNWGTFRYLPWYAFGFVSVMTVGYFYRLYSKRRCPNCSLHMKRAPATFPPKYAECSSCGIREDLLDPSMKELA